MYEKMQEVGRSIKGAKKSISTWAKGKVSPAHIFRVSTSYVVSQRKSVGLICPSLYLLNGMGSLSIKLYKFVSPPWTIFVADIFLPRTFFSM